ncbi:MAG TPA: tetratricopeptide repeat protein [Candidatus Acidoferrum sp.]|nr:tetratricopeptide repeat protein [Candidatus Acidoferrum sp.]
MPEKLRIQRAAVVPDQTVEEIVAAKLKRFAQSRREIMRSMARQKNVAVPASVEQFFDAVETGDWAQIKAAFDAINGGDSSAGHTSKRLPEVAALWASIIDTYGVAEQVHIWPAQKLLEMGNAVLSQLRPGMVYFGGTDDGRWVPTLLNATSDGEQHIVITQNGLADATYLDYVQFLYGDRFSALSQEDSQRAFSDYVDDARKRLAHDKEFPDEPKQILSGEDVRETDGKISVGGITAVMDINERLLRRLMEKNPDLSFALQESSPMKGTYAEAVPLGPIMELGARDQSTFTRERAAESATYWSTVAEQLRANPEEANGETPLKSYSKLAMGQANLFAERGFHEAAEQTYRTALNMMPSYADATTALADLLRRTGRRDEARMILDDFVRNYPDKLDALKKSRSRGSVTLSKGGNDQAK